MRVPTSHGLCLIVLLLAAGCGGSDTAPTLLPQPGVPPPNNSNPGIPVSGPELVLQSLTASVQASASASVYEMTFQVREFSLQAAATVTSVALAFDNGGSFTYSNPANALVATRVEPGATVDSLRIQLSDQPNRVVASTVTILLSFRSDAGVNGSTTATTAITAVQ